MSLGSNQICILLYADDIVLISENEQNLQKMFDHVGYWSNKWQMKVNIDNTKIIYFRNKRKPAIKYEFKINNCKINLIGNYRYLGVIFDEYLTFKLFARTLAESGGRGLTSIISKFKQFKNICYHTFTKLYDTGVNSVIRYGARHIQYVCVMISHTVCILLPVQHRFVSSAKLRNSEILHIYH